MSLLFASLALNLFTPAKLAPLKFDLGRPSLASQQVVVYESSTPVENIVGRTSKITGTITGDPAKKVAAGKISIDLASLVSGNNLRDEHLRSDVWLNTAKFPYATFESTGVKGAGKDTYVVTGNFSMHGMTHKLSTQITAKYMPESDLTKKSHFSGDVVQVKAKFKIKLSDYGVTIPPIAKGKVSDDISISISVVGTTK